MARPIQHFSENRRGRVGAFNKGLCASSDENGMPVSSGQQACSYPLRVS